MKNLEHDILQSSPELKKMPYTVPEGYFSSLKQELAAKTTPCPIVALSGCDVRRASYPKRLRVLPSVLRA